MNKEEAAKRDNKRRTQQLVRELEEKIQKLISGGKERNIIN